LARAFFPATTTPSAHEAATSDTGIVASTNIAPLEPEKSK